MKPCPFCGEQIQAAAVKCRFCGEWLDPSARPAWSQPAAPADLAQEVARQLASMVGGGQIDPSGQAAAPTAPEHQPASPEPAPVFGAPAPRSQWTDPDPDPEPEAQPLAHRAGPDYDDYQPPTDDDDAPPPAAEEPSAWDPPAWLAGRGQPAPTHAASPRRQTALFESPGGTAAAPTSEPAQAQPAVPAEPTPIQAPGSAERAGLAEVADRMQRLKQAADLVKREVEAREAQREALRAEEAAVRAQAEAQARAEADAAARAEAEAAARRAEAEAAARRAQAEAEAAARQRAQLEQAAAVRDPRETPVVAAPQGRSTVVVNRQPAVDPAPAPATPRGTDREDDDDDLADAPKGAAADFEAGFLGGLDDDDDDDDDDGDDDDFGDVQGGRSRLPLYLGIGAGLMVLAGGGVAFWAMGGFGAGGDEAAATEGADTEGETEGAQPEPEPEPEPEPAGTDTGTTGPAEPPPPSPEELEAYNAKLEEARTSYKQGKLKEAEGKAEEALAIVADEPQALAILANARIEQGKTEEAKDAASTCVENDPTVADCWLAVAVLAENDGNKARALEGWQAYLENAPDGRYARNAEKAIKRLSK